MSMMPQQGAPYSWWDCLICQGPHFGYFPNAMKTCLVVKPQYLHKARALLQGTGVIITDAGKHHLGSALGTDEFLISLQGFYMG